MKKLIILSVFALFSTIGKAQNAPQNPPKPEPEKPKVEVNTKAPNPPTENPAPISKGTPTDKTKGVTKDKPKN